MIKVFHGKKEIIISARGLNLSKAKKIMFQSAGELHREYRTFLKSKHRVLSVIGDEERVWKVFRSLFTYIEASGGAVKNKEGKLLMIYRNRHWDLPKGKMEKGESPALAAIREVEEECGVKNLRIVKQLPATQHIFFLEHECLKRTYWYEMLCLENVKPKPQAEEGIKEAKWLSKSEVKKAAEKIYPSLREILTAVSFLS